MKSLKIAIGIFTALLIVNIYMFFYLKNTVESVMDKTELARTATIDLNKEQTLKILKEIESDVNKYQHVWQVMSNHAEVDKVRSVITQCLGYAEFNSFQDVLANLYTLQYNINNLLDREEINLSNIF